MVLTLQFKGKPHISPEERISALPHANRCQLGRLTGDTDMVGSKGALDSLQWFRPLPALVLRIRLLCARSRHSTGTNHQSGGDPPC